MDRIYDSIIIGAGVIGSSIARYLSSFACDILVIEKNEDVGLESSGANSGIVHSGYDPLPNSLKAKFNVLGNKMMERVCNELDVDYIKNGSLTIAFNEEEWKTLKILYDRGITNCVDVKLLNREETLKLEPSINSNIYGSLFAKDSGVVNPFLLTIKMMENAMDNGVNLLLGSEVIKIEKIRKFYKVFTKNKSSFLTKSVINAAGNYSDKIAKMVGEIDFEITPRKGEYIVLDHFDNTYIKSTLFMCPTTLGKGVLITPTTSYNYLIGPTNDETELDDFSTNKERISYIKENAKKLISGIPYEEVIRQFSGIRSNNNKNDFIIEESANNKNFYNVAGIMSPGLTSAPAIGDYVSRLVAKNLNLKINPKFNPLVRKRNKWNTIDELDKLIEINSQYGEFVCRCEKISLYEIKDAILRNCGARTIKGLKVRTRAGFGRCQGTFCQEKILKIMSKILKEQEQNVLYSEKGSNIIKEKVK